MPRLYARFASALALIVAAMPVIFSAPAHAATQCACPKVAASGVGNTSCSASETNDRCTVDFNIFFEREARTLAFLSKAGVGIKAPDPNLNALLALSLVKNEPNQLADAIILYLTVALSAQPNASDLTKAVQSIASTVRSPAISSRLAREFDPDVRGVLPSDNNPIENFGGTRGRLLPGCIELFADNTWVMFKTSWSPYAGTPRCGGER
jgi:hypothetical protein